jgi:RpiR family transcriptional regulator, carbohydrate utilization regulator
MEIMPPDSGTRDSQTGTLIRLRGLYPSLKTALRKVADVILRQPEMAIYASVNEVAAVAAVSEATVMRFCRILGFKGFQDFKIALAREMVIPSPRLQEEVIGEAEDDLALVRKVFQTNGAALQDTLEILEIEAMQEAVQLLLAARQIIVAGVGGSSPAVTYAGNRFQLFGLRPYMCTDFYLMVMAASMLSREDVVLAISNLGTTREIVETAGIARDQGARVMCITNNSLSPLARLSNPALVTASREVTLPETAVASLVCQISILDALCALIAQAQGQKSRENLEKMGKAMVRVGVMRDPAK